MPFLASSENGFAGRLNERLWAFVNGGLKEDELATFISGKLDQADDNVYLLEEEIEYPDAAMELHAVLHSAFTLYHEALTNLEEFLWGEEEVEDGLPGIMRELLRADRLTGAFSEELGEMADPTVEVDWLF